MNKAEQIAFMDSLTVEQRAKIAQIIRSAYIMGDYCCCDEDGGSVWQESVQDTLDSLAAWFHSYKGKLPPNEYTRLDFVFCG